MGRLEIVRSFFLALGSTIFLFLCGVYVPLGGILLLPLISQPVLAFGLKYGKGKGTGLLLLAAALLLFFGAPELAMGYSLFAAMIALLFISFGRRWPIEWVVAGAAAAMLVVSFLVLWALFGSPSYLWEGIRAALRENLEIWLRVYDKIGISEEGIDLLRQRAPQIVELVLKILPALVYSAFSALILVNLLLLCRRFPERRSLFISSGDLREWRSPEPLIWCFLLSGFLIFLPGAETVVATVSLNIFLIIAVFYFFQGLAIIAYYFHHKNVPYFLRSMAYVVIVFEQFVTLFVVGLGLFDLWGDFRRLKKKDLNPSQVS